MYQRIGDRDRAIEDYDNSVRLCPDYETDLINSNFRYGGQLLVDKAVKLLECVEKDTSRPYAFRAYYAGVKILLQNNKHKACRRFERALELGFNPDAKIAEHLENLTI